MKRRKKRKVKGGGEREDEGDGKKVLGGERGGGRGEVEEELGRGGEGREGRKVAWYCCPVDNGSLDS